MKLQKQLSNRIGNKTYDKWVIIIPPKLIEKLGWKDGQELNADLKTNKLVIQKEDWED